MEYRLNKYISNSGYCSRREADRFIESGNVTINGKRATIGMRVYPGQKVKVNGELIVNKIEPVYIALNKPVGIVSTTDPAEKHNIVNFISHEQRIFPIGRLDKDSQGLILLTNDGDIVNKILRAGNNHKKEYIVTVNKPITKEFLTKMAQGVPILDRVTRRCELEQINPYTFKISLIQGLNRQIRRMCEYFNYDVLKLERIQIMNIKLGTLGQGNWRDLTVPELEGLFDMLENSEKTAVKKKPKSNKAFNKALEEFDIKTNYRKSGIATKYQDKSQPAKSKPSKGKPVSEEKPKPQKNRGKSPSGPRIGKQKVAVNRPKSASKPQSKKR
ncbi:23S rRNA pseudouridine(2604) synthase RluF [Parabacteroides sp. PF5-9]|uniref:23S rRNA pseudouridine(2604) synthase RluF n=1 Tax=Parabacteroides sp. PF5-9 TaxID=1742404 RepID=UPI002476962A|nr:23S rRNA pseudouridine(2604) synthase RluF [Parabacteroides sp. PF5-9]MDH6357317.1 23S rRNA pseudouridine2604 synthase [Parabacteroides sp. PF5-9]